MSNLKIRYAIIGMMTVPWIGFVALYNAGLHQHYIRYLLPMFVGALSGYLIGLMKTRFLEKKAGLEAAIIALKEENKGRKRAEEELRTDKELLAVTLRSLGEGVVSVNPEGEITLFNKTAEKITGVSSSKAIGKPVEEVISLIDHDNREEARNPIRCGLQGQSHCSTDPNTLLISQEGREYYIEDNGLPIYDALHEVVGAVWVFRDVSEKRKAEAELFKARQLDSLGVLAGGIAHDFNNLLVGVMGNISLASHLLKEQDEARLLLDEAQKASTQAGALARQLLTFSRGGEPVKEVRSIVDILKKSAHSVLKDSSVSLKLDAAEDLKHVDIDKGQIAQVIQNLVLNAVEAIEGAGTIQISCQNVDGQKASVQLEETSLGYVEIRIKDSGTGIASDDLERIFEPYFTTKMTGSGLGLPIAHSVIARHDGHLSVESTSGEGATFIIYLPAISPSDSSTESAKSVHAPSSKRILLMDDEEMVRNVAEKMLKHFGHQVEVAASGEEALARYDELLENGEKIDLFIMDLNVPDAMGGLEAMKHLLERDPEIKAIVTSGYSSDPVMANFREYGFKDMLAKPFQLQELKRVVSAVFE